MSRNISCVHTPHFHVIDVDFLPVRRFFIIHAARELQLVFPSSYATATTIRSMHLAMDGARQAKKKMKALSLGFAYAVICRVLSQFAIGILWVSTEKI